MLVLLNNFRIGLLDQRLGGSEMRQVQGYRSLRHHASVRDENFAPRRLHPTRGGINFENLLVLGIALFFALSFMVSVVTSVWASLRETAAVLQDATHPR